jgi:hypothetical protein
MADAPGFDEEDQRTAGGRLRCQRVHASALGRAARFRQRQRKVGDATRIAQPDSHGDVFGIRVDLPAWRSG